MSYGIKLEIQIKTTGGKEYTHTEMKEIISNALWECEAFRDVIIFFYEGDTKDG